MEKLMRQCPKCKTIYDFKKEDVENEKPMYAIDEDNILLKFKCIVCGFIEEIEMNPLKIPGLKFK